MFSAIGDLQYTMSMLKEAAMLSALAYDAIHGNKSDDVSTNEAYKQYGEGWIKDRLNRGYLHTTRAGAGKTSSVNFSRFEIESLKRSEKLIADAYKKLAQS